MSRLPCLHGLAVQPLLMPDVQPPTTRHRVRVERLPPLFRDGELTDNLVAFGRRLHPSHRTLWREAVQQPVRTGNRAVLLVSVSPLDRAGLPLDTEPAALVVARCLDVLLPQDRLAEQEVGLSVRPYPAHADGLVFEGELEQFAAFVVAAADEYMAVAAGHFPYVGDIAPQGYRTPADSCHFGTVRVKLSRRLACISAVSSPPYCRAATWAAISPSW